MLMSYHTQSRLVRQFNLVNCIKFMDLEGTRKNKYLNIT
jgi:hypothetical protein